MSAYHFYETPPFFHDTACVDPELREYNTFDGAMSWNQQQHIPFEKYPYYHQSNPESAFMNTGMTRMVATAPQPKLASFPRHCSPFDPTASTCSSAQSPPGGGSEFSLDNPSTPADDTTLFPYAPSDHWSSHGQQFLLTGVATSFVKPEEISYNQAQPISNYEDKVEFPNRGFSLSSNDSSYDTQIEPSQIPRSTSPSAMSQGIQEVICVAPSYPPIDTDDEESSFERGGDNSQADDEKDMDYSPRGARKRTNSNTGCATTRRKRSNTSQANSPVKKPRQAPSSPLVQRSTMKVALMTKGSFPCSECRDVTFQDQSGLQKHIKQQHTRPFVCIFHFAGCDSTFASKNEWKRHVASQHLLLNYWLCQQETCAKLSNTSGSSTKATGTSRHRSSNALQPQTTFSAALPDGAIFNRKDLYTQHLRRMHIPPAFKKQVKAKKTVPEWEERVRACQEEAHKLRCELPDHMSCPAPECSFQASGPNAWDERMEHVAKHLEKAASGLEAPITFGGVNDPTLMDWVSRHDVAVVKDDGKGGWTLHNPLKPVRSGGKNPTNNSSDNYGEEDAPGEDED